MPVRMRLRWPLLALLPALACGGNLANAGGGDDASGFGGGAAVDGGGDAPGGGSLDAGTEAADAGTPVLDAGPRDAGTEDAGHVTIFDGDGGTPSGPPPPYVINGGTLASLDFGVVGDTRPWIYDDTAQYPTAIITQIFQDMANLSPPIAFVTATGDYMFADPILGTEASKQADLFVGAAQKFLSVGPVWTSMGNHECDWATSNDNCFGQDTSNPNYEAFLQDILAPLGIPNQVPYFAVTYSSSDPTRPWTAKFVYIAPNSWDTANDTQGKWAQQVLAIPTTYTFLVRHQPTNNPGGNPPAPGVPPTDALLQEYPFTLKLTGHSHSYMYDQKNREIVNGLGGAPFDTGYNGDYGYVVCRQRADMAIQCSLYDYKSNAVAGDPNATLAVNPDGSSTPAQ